MYRWNHIHCWILFAWLLPAGQVLATPESLLNEAYQAAHQRSDASQYPFTINSMEQGGVLSADVFMLLDVSYGEFRDRLQNPRNWCDFLLLTLNIKTCVNRELSGRQYLVLYAGRKEYQPPEITYQLKYAFHMAENRPQYFDVKLYADKGPMLTSDYHIQVQATPYGKQTLLRLGMSYKTSVFSRAATYTYLTTLGRNKIGFTVIGKDEHGRPVYVDGVKGVIERNVMRYFLALSVYLDAMKVTDRPDFRTMLQSWFDATERYHAQLHEYDIDTYIKAKLHERLNQQELQQKADSRALSGRKRG